MTEIEALRREVKDLRDRVTRLERGKGVPMVKLRTVPIGTTRRGRSPVARLLAGAVMRAKKHGIQYTHEQLSRMIDRGVMMLGYSIALGAVAACFPKEKWTAMGAFQIGECWRLNLEPKERAEREARWAREGRSLDGGN